MPDQQGDSTKSGWGESPTRPQGQRRDVPYLMYNNADIAQFLPLADIQYHCTIISVNGWHQPVEIWTHDIYANGRFITNVFCKNTSMGDDRCPLCRANNKRQNELGGGKLRNDERPYPLKKKYVFPMIVDEVPEKPFVFYKVPEAMIKDIHNQFKIAGKPVKIVVMKTGSGMTNTRYTVSSTGVPIDSKIADCKAVPVIEPETYKDFLTSLEDFTKFEFIDWDSASEHNQANTPSQQPQQVSAPVQTPNPSEEAIKDELPSTVNGNDPVVVANAHKLTSGPYVDKTLGELDTNVLEIIAKNFKGVEQEYAKVILKSRGVNV